MYLRTVKVRSSNGTLNEYVRVVEAYRDNGKVKQRTLAELGRKDRTGSLVQVQALAEEKADDSWLRRSTAPPHPRQ